MRGSVGSGLAVTVGRGGATSSQSRGWKTATEARAAAVGAVTGLPEASMRLRHRRRRAAPAGWTDRSQAGSGRRPGSGSSRPWRWRALVGSERSPIGGATGIASSRATAAATAKRTSLAMKLKRAISGSALTLCASLSPLASQLAPSSLPQRHLASG